MTKRHKIAPPEAIQRDYHTLKSSEVLRVGGEVEQLILLYGVMSHAQEGHVRFNGIKYPNTSFVDVARALHFSTQLLYSFQRELLDEVDGWVRRVLSGEQLAFCRSAEGEPLFRFPLFYFLPIEPEEVLRGLYLGGLRDDPDVRAEAEARYRFRIGGGRIYPVNRAILHRLNLDGERLAREEHAEKLPHYKQIGLIVEKRKDDVHPMYIRHRVGQGASDDAAILAAGKLYSLSTAVGVFIADLIDTLEKGLPDYRDRDLELGLRIEQEFKHLQLSREEVYRLIYLSAQPKGNHEWPDCSMRHFLRVDRRYELCAIECHFLYLMGEPTPDLRIGKKGYPVHSFYRELEERIDSLA